MILSVVIVNFNVKYFLEQCLYSLKKAVDRSLLLSANTEVFIVDNASTDGSVAFLQPLYPDFHFIQNTENSGFAKGNNQVLPACTGECVLFLNPDTILAEDCLDLCIRFFQSNPDAGAAGVRMIDGSGRFLKESKRGFPDPRAAFFKMTGLAGVFPRSRLFAAYHAGHLDPHSNHPVDILSGACMMVRREVLNKTGGFDERFFMYAEDIDLSYRIRKAGFQNYYLASAGIIHFKGESTRRDRRYVKQFHIAMNQFMKKYFRGSSVLLFIMTLAVNLKMRLGVIGLPFQKKTTRSRQNKSVFIKGDQQDSSAIRMALDKAGIHLMETEAAADSVLFCAGGQKTIKSVIQDLEGSTQKRTCFIHCSGTHAIVGGSSGKEKGEIIFW